MAPHCKFKVRVTAEIEMKIESFYSLKPVLQYLNMFSQSQKHALFYRNNLNQFITEELKVFSKG